MNNTYGYARVSSKSQYEDRQMISMNGRFQILPQNIFIDKQSGRDFNRPAYHQLMCRLKKGDLLIVCSIDRLGRNYSEILEQWRRITHDLEVDIVVLDMPLLDTRQNRDLLGTLISDLVLPPARRDCRRPDARGEVRQAHRKAGAAGSPGIPGMV